MDNNELKHVGVLGMKWGVRRGSSNSGGGSTTRKSSSSSQKPVKLSRKERRYQRDLAIAKVRRAQTKKFLKEMVDSTKGAAEKRAKEKKFWEDFLKDDLNATPESVAKERRQTGRTLAAAGLLIVGGVALSNVIKYGAP